MPRKKAKQGLRGYPVGTVAFYGPDNRRASKVAVSVIRTEGAEPELKRWFSDTGDVRTDTAIYDEIAGWLRQQSVRSIGMREHIIGCPTRKGSITRSARLARNVRTGRGETGGATCRSRMKSSSDERAAKGERHFEIALASRPPRSRAPLGSAP